MTDVREIDPEEVLASLTDKQVEVLDRLLLHMTNKEIARDLDISPNTVEQRLLAVRQKLGAANRNEAARLYASLRGEWGKSPYAFPVVDPAPPGDLGRARDLPQSALFQIGDFTSPEDWYPRRGLLAGLEALDARFGKFGRVVLIVMLAFMLAATVVLSLSVASGIDQIA